MILWFLKSNKKIYLLDDSIDVVAVKPFGGKHKLALIETCGEKLLLAASEKGVTLLSHVGNHLVPEQDESNSGGFGGFSMPDLNPVPRAETADSQDEVIPVPSATTADASRPLAKELPKLESDDSLKMATAKINSGSLSKEGRLALVVTSLSSQGPKRNVTRHKSLVYSFTERLERKSALDARCLRPGA
jgi:flagellar biogenesis protein FliO